MRYVWLIAFLLVACGAEPTHAPDVQGANITWSGTFQELDPRLQAVYENTATCLKVNFGIERADVAPVFYEATGAFLCGGTEALGCTVSDTAIYFQHWMSGILSHETVHWIARVGNEAHNNILFTTCDQLVQ
jgi:hypothetical protein